MATQNLKTPVQAAKELDVRPQIVYGFIRRGSLRTFPNPDGGTQVVDVESVKTLLMGVKHHRERDPLTGQLVKHDPGVSKGTLLSYHGHGRGEKKPRAHRVVTVTEIIQGDVTLIQTKKVDADGNVLLGTLYEAESLHEMISRGKCHIESAESLLAVLMFHWTHSGNLELAASLGLWCDVHGLKVADMVEKEGGVEKVIESTDIVEGRDDD